jgi:hypothetical protein
MQEPDDADDIARARTRPSHAVHAVVSQQHRQVRDGKE